MHLIVTLIAITYYTTKWNIEGHVTLKAAI